MVTNHHVVDGCAANELMANPFGGNNVTFSKMVSDPDVDLALLKPSQHIAGGLELDAGADPSLGTAVETWGFPLTYNGPAPLLSRGYVAGYSEDGQGSRQVKHIVVNGAFNPGNSGGPLLRVNDNKVIGVVVAKFHLYPAYVKDAIATLSSNSFGMMYNGVDASGKQVQVSEAQVVALILEQFYKTTQVMIGEAISVSELRSFIKSKERELL
jgi:S1-C subfamily serine protease